MPSLTFLTGGQHDRVSTSFFELVFDVAPAISQHLCCCSCHAIAAFRLCSKSGSSASYTAIAYANSLGAAVTGAVGLGLTDFAAARALSEVTAEFVPDSSRHGAYAARHAVFVDAYEHLEPWFTRSVR